MSSYKIYKALPIETFQRLISSQTQNEEEKESDSDKLIHLLPLRLQEKAKRILMVTSHVLSYHVFSPTYNYIEL